jgi:hypothetical protein
MSCLNRAPAEWSDQYVKLGLARDVSLSSAFRAFLGCKTLSRPPRCAVASAHEPLAARFGETNPIVSNVISNVTFLPPAHPPLQFANRRDLASDVIQPGHLKCCLVRQALPIVHAN